jgi:hypothetical protein
MERVGQGINPTGDAYRYSKKELTLMKCGYINPKAIIIIPINREGHFEKLTRIPVALKEKTIIRIARMVNSIPLKGFLFDQARMATEITGKHKRTLMSLFVGCQLTKRQIMKK